MSNHISVPKEVLDNVISVLFMYSESEWGWDGEDNSVVRSWGEVYPEPKGFHFKSGGDMAKIALGELQRLLTQRALDVSYCACPPSVPRYDAGDGWKCHWCHRPRK